jgi:hypothetical protein
LAVDKNKTLLALLSGGAGAVALTLLHQTLKASRSDAPRADALGREALRKGFEAAGKEPPAEDTLQLAALCGDLAGNTLYYSAVGLTEPENGMRTGALLGLAAGAGAVLLPGPLGFDESATNRTVQTQAMALGIYLAGGLVAGLVYRAMAR